MKYIVVVQNVGFSMSGSLERIVVNTVGFTMHGWNKFCLEKTGMGCAQKSCFQHGLNRQC